MAQHDPATHSPGGSDTVLYANDHARVTRRTLPGDAGRVVVKQAIGAEAMRRLRHEAVMLERLAKIDGVVRLASVPAEPNTLVMQDEGAVSLTDYLRTHKLDTEQVLAYGTALTHIIARVHKAGVLHKDIGPANLLIHPETLQPTLIDFNIAAELSAQHAVAEVQTGMAGTLSYMSPEQTGRTGGIPDQRSDLYSLGITLYELLTHRKPFESTDLLELVHDHLVRVPEAPVTLNPAVPQMLSDVVMRLLEKEPDRRYQSAEGLIQDLGLISAGLKAGGIVPFTLCRFDFGTRLKAPAQLFDIEPQRAALREAFAAARSGHTPMVLLEGPTGAGKSALIDDFRSSISAQRPWVVVVRFTPEMQGTEGNGLDSLQALGRQLMALPEDQLVIYRERILKGLEGHLGIGASLLPEFQMLLGEHPAVELAPEEAGKRTALATLALLRSVASAERPLVMIYDDLQWAPKLSLKSLDSSFMGKQGIASLMLLCSVSTDHCATDAELQALLARWKTGPRTRPAIALTPLSPAAAGEFVASILRLPQAEARRLADALALRTDHNPGHTLSLLNALRDDGLLVQQQGDWLWSADALRRYVGHSSPAELAERIASLPTEAAELLRALACLGLQTPQATLLAATGCKRPALAKRVAPCVDEGLVIAEDSSMRCASAGVQQAALASMGGDARVALHLALARRLVSAKNAEALQRATAEQFLHAVDALDDSECRLAAGLLERAGDALRAEGQIEPSERHLGAALRCLLKVAEAGDTAHLFDLRVKQLQALFELGRHAEIDSAYQQLLTTAPAPELLSAPVRFQIYSMIARQRFGDAVTIGLDLLALLGSAKPADIRPDLGAGMQRLVAWYRGEDRALDFDRPEISEPRALALSQTIPETMTPAYFADPGVWAWLALLTHRLWVEHGPHSRLVSAVGSLPFVLVGAPQDFRGAYTVGRHMIAVSEKRGYEQGGALSRCVFAIAAAHWVDPLEMVLEEFHRARADLLRMREPFVAFTYVASDIALDCQPTLKLAGPEVDAGLDFAREQGNMDFLQRYQPRKQLQLALAGLTRAAGALSDEHFDEAAYTAKLDPTGPTAATYHMVASIRAALFNDMPALAAHSAKAVPLSARTPGYYLASVARVLRGLSLCEQLRSAVEADRAALLDELDKTLAWLGARAADAPANFAHLLLWLQAERAWAVDTVWTAGAAFDAAVQAVAELPRPWHRALIHERAALFRLAQGMEESAKPLLTTACNQYDTWGASAKVKELRRKYAFLRATSKLGNGTLGTAGTQSTVVDTEMVDMMGVLRASQALSSETSLSRLTAQVGKVLGAITGATGVYLVVRPEEGSSAWVMASSLGEGGEAVTVEQAGARGEVPLSAFRYAERTKDVLVIDDAPSDDRFSADPYVEKFSQCSLVLAPILKQGQLNAMLVLENHQRRAAFSAERLNSVSMIAGQLAVSLDNALLYASLEKRVAERTAQLRQKTNDINAMLQNMPQGVLTVMNGGHIHPEYSAYLATILETTEIAERQVMELLFSGSSLGADSLSQVDAAIASVIGEDEMNYEFNSHLLVTEFDKTMPDGRVKSLALSWSPITSDNGNVDKLMLCLRDVTELKRLELEANTRKRELQMIGEILAVSQEKFHEFIDSARGFIDENRRLIEQGEDSRAERREDNINLLFRNMHTIKGNARTYGLLGLTNQVHVVEQSYDDLRQNTEAEWVREALLADLESVKVLVDTYSHVNDSVLGRKGPGRRASVEKFLMVEKETVQQAVQQLLTADQRDLAAMRAALNRVGSTLHMIGTQPLGVILAGTLESLPSLAQELGKAAPVVAIEDRGIVVRTQAGGLLKNLFTHLLRNSVDHGIECAADRRAAGKPAAGRISLDVSVDDGKLWIRLQDDGRGLAIAKIRQRATEQNLITRGARSTDDEVAQLIFRSGFSTAEQVTEVSGRGVGMDAVRGFLEKEGGSIGIRFLDEREGADYRAFETVIALPDKYAASLSAAMSFDTLYARLQAAKPARA
ncbi:MAG: AAA family ATPase [Rhizobacter sp.]|nr:AAA family ATPase [Rhizobacter sp.]